MSVFLSLLKSKNKSEEKDFNRIRAGDQGICFKFHCLMIASRISEIFLGISFILEEGDSIPKLSLLLGVG